MSRIPPEVDRLMWALAENPVSEAMDEFGKRHPDLRGELLKRVEMVRDLRNEVKTSGKVKHQIPKFEPKTPPNAAPPRGAYVAFGLGVVAISFAAFTGITSVRTPSPTPAVIPEAQVERPFTVPAVITKPNPPYVQPNPPLRTESSPPAPNVEPPLAEKRRDLNLKDVQLLDALSLITAGTNLKLEVGPGFVNQKVTLAFQDRTTKEMLMEMAKDYAFSVSDEGNGQFLVLPVPDNGSESGDHSNTQRRIGP